MFGRYPPEPVHSTYAYLRVLILTWAADAEEAAGMLLGQMTVEAVGVLGRAQHDADQTAQIEDAGAAVLDPAGLQFVQRPIESYSG